MFWFVFLQSYSSVLKRKCCGTRQICVSIFDYLCRQLCDTAISTLIAKPCQSELQISHTRSLPHSFCSPAGCRASTPRTDLLTLCYILLLTLVLGSMDLKAILVIKAAQLYFLPWSLNLSDYFRQILSFIVRDWGSDF